jgi:type II secretory pathway pseudopilin PulG
MLATIIGTNVDIVDSASCNRREKKMSFRLKTDRSPSRRAVAGFTMIELVGALAIISTLSTAFLPVLQQKREGANFAAVLQDFHSIGDALGAQYRKAGKFPTDLDSILSLAPDFNNATELHNAYHMILDRGTPQAVRFIAEPVAGVTGSMTGILDVTVVGGNVVSMIRNVATPGSDAARASMMNANAESVAKVFSAILNRQTGETPGQAMVQIRQTLVGPGSGITQPSFDMLHPNGPSLSFASIQRAIGECDGSVRVLCDGSVRAPFPGILGGDCAEYAIGRPG